MTKPRDLSVGFNFPKWLSSCLCCHKPSTWSTRLYHSELLRHIAVIIIIVRRHSVAGRYDLSRTTSSGIEVHLRNPHYNLNTAGHHFCWFNEKTNWKIYQAKVMGVGNEYAVLWKACRNIHLMLQMIQFGNRRLPDLYFWKTIDTINTTPGYCAFEPSELFLLRTRLNLTSKVLTLAWITAKIWTELRAPHRSTSCFETMYRWSGNPKFR